MSLGFFESMGVGLNGLPARKRWRSRQISSYDRSGGNMDFISVPARGGSVIGDVEGAGCVSWIWFTLRSRDPEILRKTILRFYWDGEEDPSVETPFGDNVKWSWMVQIGGLNLTEYVDERGSPTMKFQESTLNRLMTRQPDTAFKPVFASEYSYVLVYEVDYEAGQT